MEVLLLRGKETATLLESSELEAIDVVAEAYKAHARGNTSLPHSSFLRFPDSDRDRVIALPAYLGGDFQRAGIKWIASVPGNLERGLPRASAAIILNDRLTGRPQAILEGSLISARRTAASAALAARELHQRPPSCIGLVGCGPINFEIVRHLVAVWPESMDFRLFDLDLGRARAFADQLQDHQAGSRCQVGSSTQDVLAASDLVSFATTAIKPHVDDLKICPVESTVLHISLRDLTPSAILTHDNVVDDLDHVCRADTSIHLASETRGNRDFVRASLGEVLLGTAPPKPASDGLTIFSPFGLGILDLALADLVYRRAQREDLGTWIDDFYL